MSLSSELKQIVFYRKEGIKMNVIYTELLPEGITMKFDDGTIFIGVKARSEIKKDEESVTYIEEQDTDHKKIVE